MRRVGKFIFVSRNCDTRKVIRPVCLAEQHAAVPSIPSTTSVAQIGLRGFKADSRLRADVVSVY